VPDVAQLLTSLHTAGPPDPAYPPLERHVAYLFDAWARHRKQQPELIEVVSPDLFERGRRLASGLAEQTSPAVLLHGDLTAVNVLYGEISAASWQSTQPRASGTQRSMPSTSCWVLANLPICGGRMT
jgi:Ser/Thr protein kinase RdoA (MazF antagonist)